MDTSYYVIATVLGAVLMLVEHGIARQRGVSAYRFDDTLNNVSNFLGELVLTAVLYLNVFSAYHWLETKVGVVAFSEAGAALWVGSFLAVDALYYVGHRACHRVGVLWALHTVHHQSHEFNLGVGLRGPMLSALQIAPFMLPLAIVGVPSEVLFPIYAFHTVYKLVVHTRLVGKLGPLEWIFITPSQHRVHHAHDEAYRGRNYGGVLNLWDRLCGTWTVEQQEPSFEPIAEEGEARIYDAIHNNVEPWRRLFRRASGGGVVRFVAVLFGPPPMASDHDDARPTLRSGPSSGNNGRHRAVLALRLCGAGAMTLLLLQFGHRLPLLVGTACGVAVMLSIAKVGRALSLPSGNEGSHSPA